MKTKTALQFRQQFGQILDGFGIESEPIVIIKNNKPVAAVIPYETYQRRFMEYQERSERQQLLERFKASAKRTTADSVSMLRELRYGKS